MGLYDGWKTLERLCPDELAAARLEHPAPGGPPGEPPARPRPAVVQDTLVQLQVLAYQARQIRTAGAPGAPACLWPGLAAGLVTHALDYWAPARPALLVLVADKPESVTRLKAETQAKRVRALEKKSPFVKLPAGELAIDPATERVLHVRPGGAVVVPGAYVEDLLGERAARPLLLRHLGELLRTQDWLRHRLAHAGTDLVLDLGGGCCWRLPAGAKAWEKHAGDAPWGPVPAGEADVGCFGWALRWWALHGRGALVAVETIDTDFWLLGLLLLASPAGRGGALWLRFYRKQLLDLARAYERLRDSGKLWPVLRTLSLNGSDFLPHKDVCPGVGGEYLFRVQVLRHQPAREALVFPDFAGFLRDICDTYSVKAGRRPAPPACDALELHAQLARAHRKLPTLDKLRESWAVHTQQCDYWVAGLAELAPPPPGPAKEEGAQPAPLHGAAGAGP